MGKFSEFILAPGTAATAIRQGIRNLGFAYLEEVRKWVAVDSVQDFTEAEKQQGRDNLGITGGGTLPIPVPIDKGGTNATTANQAKTNLGLVAVASSGSASDLITGTLDAARLPATITGAKNFTSPAVIEASNATTSTDYLRLNPTDFGTGKPFLYFKKNTVASEWTMGLWDGVNSAGTISVVATTVNFTGAANFTGNVTSQGAVTGVAGLYATDGNVISRSNGNRHLWFQNNSGVNRGLVYHDNNANGIDIQLYDTSGVFVHKASFFQGGGALWTGSRFTIGGGGPSADFVIQTNDLTGSYRIIGNSASELFIQKSNDRFVANAPTLLWWNALSEATFPEGVFAKTFISTSDGLGQNIRVGNDVWLGDINVGSTMSVRGASDANQGWIKFGNSVPALGVNGNVSNDRLYWGGSFFMQSDGNMFLPMYGDYLSNVMAAKAGLYTGSTDNEVNFPIGHNVIARGSSTPGRNQTGTVRLGGPLEYRYTGSGSILSGTWRMHGYFDDAEGGLSGALFQRTG